MNSKVAKVLSSHICWAATGRIRHHSDLPATLNCRRVMEIYPLKSLLLIRKFTCQFRVILVAYSDEIRRDCRFRTQRPRGNDRSPQTRTPATPITTFSRSSMSFAWRQYPSPIDIRPVEPPDTSRLSLPSQRANTNSEYL